MRSVTDQIADSPQIEQLDWSIQHAIEKNCGNDTWEFIFRVILRPVDEQISQARLGF